MNTGNLLVQECSAAQVNPSSCSDDGDDYGPAERIQERYSVDAPDPESPLDLHLNEIHFAS